MFLDGASVHPYGSFYLDVADKSIKGIAVIVGGLWTYVNFARSRTFKRKLEPKVSAQLFKASTDWYVKVYSNLKNVGQSKYPIEQKGTVVEVTSLGPSGRGEPIYSAIFERHGWIEPGEEIGDSLIFAIADPAQAVGFLVNLRIISQSRIMKKRIEWNANCIVSQYLSKDATVEAD